MDHEEMRFAIMAEFQNAVKILQASVNRFQIVIIPGDQWNARHIVKFDTVTGDTWELGTYLPDGEHTSVWTWKTLQNCNERPNDAETKNCEA